MPGTSAQEQVGLGEARVTGENTLIQSFLLILDGGTVKYNLIGAGPDGLKYVEITVQDKIVNHKECRDKTECVMSGGVSLPSLPSQVFTALVRDSRGVTQTEKIRVTPVKDGSRVYFVGAVPGLGAAPVVLAAGAPAAEPAGNAEAAASGSEPIPGTGSPAEGNKEISITTPGPELKIDVVRNGDNDYTLKINASDKLGVDFIEILENGNFIDVEICGNSTGCVMDRTLQGRSPGRNKYLVKSMNAGGALSFQEQILYFTE